MKENASLISIQQVKDKVIQLAQTLIVKTCLLKVYSKYKSIPLTGDRSLISQFIRKNAHLKDDNIIQLFHKQFFEDIVEGLRKDRIKEEYIIEKRRLEVEWKDENKVLESCPGKELVEKIIDWVSKEYKIQISIQDFYSNISPEEIDQDFHKFVDLIIQKCTYEAAAYLRNYDPPIRHIRLYRNQLYYNAYYRVSLPEVNDNLLFFAGMMDRKNGVDRKKSSVIIAYDWRKGKLVKKTSIMENVKFINMEYNCTADLLFATAEIVRRNELVDSIFVIDPRTDHIYKYELYPDCTEGKEGALSDLVVKAINKQSGIIYAGSVYSHGGIKALYMIEYSIIGNSARFSHKLLRIGRYGPLSICSDLRKEKIYVLSQDRQEDLGLMPVITVIDSYSGNTIDKICISTTFGSVSPYEGHLLSIDSKSSTLAVVINEMLYLVNLSNKKIIKILKDKKYFFVVTSPVTDKLYAIAEEEDLESSQPHYNSLHVIDSNLQLHQITKFDPVIEATNIRCSNSVICINFKHKELENEYSFWLFEEVIKSLPMVPKR
jgi:hypothetical protein